MRIFTLTAALTLSLPAPVVAEPFLLQGEQPSPKGDGQKTNQSGDVQSGSAENKKTVASPMAGNATNPVIASTDTQNKLSFDNRDIPNDEPKWTDKIQAVSAGFSLIIALFLLLLGFGQLKIYRRQADIMDEQAKISTETLVATKIAADAASASAIATRDSVFTMKDTAIRQLRAYVTIDASQVTVLEQKGFRKTRIIIKNSGQTPAFDLSHWNNIVIAPYPPDESIFVGFDEGQHLSKTFLGAGLILSKVGEYHQQIGADEIGALRAGTLAFYVWGEIEYTDIFGHVRLTKYRVMQGGPSGVVGEDLTYCDNGNHAE